MKPIFKPPVDFVFGFQAKRNEHDAKNWHIRQEYPGITIARSIMQDGTLSVDIAFHAENQKQFERFSRDAILCACLEAQECKTSPSNGCLNVWNVIPPAKMRIVDKDNQPFGIDYNTSLRYREVLEAAEQTFNRFVGMSQKLASAPSHP